LVFASHVTLGDMRTLLTTGGNVALAPWRPAGPGGCADVCLARSNDERVRDLCEQVGCFFWLNGFLLQIRQQ